MVPEFLSKKSPLLPANDFVFRKVFAERKDLLPNLLAAVRIPRPMTLRTSLAALLLASLLALAGQPPKACTLFAAIGDEVENGDCLIAKVRDEQPWTQTLKMVAPREGYRYFGVFTGKRQTYNMGVNEKGLVAFRSTAGSIPRATRRKYPRYKSPDGLTGLEVLIRECASVDEALARTELYLEPVNCMLADRQEIAFVEVLPGGQMQVQRSKRGVLAHTNHYILPASLAYNEKIGQSSAIRLERIRELLRTTPRPLSLASFKAMTQDCIAGPENSIFRTGSKPEKLRTLAMLVVRLPREGAPELWLKWQERPQDNSPWREISLPVHFDRMAAGQIF